MAERSMVLDVRFPRDPAANGRVVMCPWGCGQPDEWCVCDE